MHDEFLLSLSPPSPDWQATGALFRPQDQRDFRLELLPEVIEARAAGLPEEFSRASQMQGVYNQGSIPKCVAASTCLAKGMEEVADIGRWQLYDDDELYRANGGNGTNGVPTGQVLDYARNTGLLARDSQRRFRIASYLFVPQTPNEFRMTLAAAIQATGPCVLAILLPQNFGWTSSGQPTNGYHQVVALGWQGLSDNGYCEIGNSWGGNWGQNGRGRVPWAYIEQNNFLNRYNYAARMEDFRDGSVEPPPPDPINNPAAKLMELANAARAQRGLPAFTPDARLTAAAAGHSADMANRNYYSHQSPEGEGPEQRLQKQGISGVAWAENIAAGISDPAAALQQWVNSPPHAANLFNPQMTHAGMGYAAGPGRYRYYWTQVFARLQDAPPPVRRLSVSAVTGRDTCPLIGPNDRFTVSGAGFSMPGLRVEIGGVVCQHEVVSDSVLSVMPPTTRLMGNLTVTAGTDQVRGPYVAIREAV